MDIDQIDIVVTWVDGNDPEWQARYRQYNQNVEEGGESLIRFRDWGLLKYWFRGIEKFAPWVRKVHFVTSGERPEWLNLECSKLNWVKHEEFIPAEYLPTFNSNAIEANFHRIEGLSESFIYFNDDVFLIKEAKATDFFKKGLACDYGVMSAGTVIHMAVNNLIVIGKNFDKHTVMKQNFSKWFSLKYGFKVLNNILLYPWRDFSGFIDPHVAFSFNKSSFEEVWGAAPETIDATCRRRFRSSDDINLWLFRYWQLAKGAFVPKNTLKASISLEITEKDLEKVKDIVTHQTHQIVCFNDSKEIRSFDQVRQEVDNSFLKILPQKSSFEK